MCDCAKKKDPKDIEARDMNTELFYASRRKPDKVLVGFPGSDCVVVDLPRGKEVGFNTFMMMIVKKNYGSKIYYNDQFIDCPVTMGKLKISRGDFLVIMQ